MEEGGSQQREHFLGPCLSYLSFVAANRPRAIERSQNPLELIEFLESKIQLHLRGCSQSTVHLVQKTPAEVLKSARLKVTQEADDFARRTSNLH